MDLPYIAVLMTVADKNGAVEIVHRLLHERLIACANIVAPASSLFLWEGKIDESDELLVIMKSRRELFPQLSGRIREMHTYQVPEIIALLVIGGSLPYLYRLGASLHPVGE